MERNLPDWTSLPRNRRALRSTPSTEETYVNPTYDPTAEVQYYPPDSEFSEIDYQSPIPNQPASVVPTSALGAQVSDSLPSEVLPYPPTDIYETADEILVYIDVPGLTQEALQLHSAGMSITITAERDPDEGSENTKAKDWRPIQQERTFSFQRTITLPVLTNFEQATAEYINGVCKVTIPKREESKQREITISQ